MKPAVWLFDRRTDLMAFGGSALLSLAALAVGAHQGWLDAELAPAVFFVSIVLVDVAHVWSTIFRVYLDPIELSRRPLLYWFTPVFAWIIGITLYQSGRLVFWRAFAYLAVIHFVRQQYGFMRLYRVRNSETRFSALDTVTIYTVTLYPLLYWHTQLPREFDWFMTGDFLPVPALLESIARPLYWLVLLAYLGRTLWARFKLGEANPGRDLLVATTAVCWYAGIVALNSDYAFTVTNVFIHGIPYFVLIRRYGLAHGDPSGLGRRLLARGWLPMLLVLWALAYGEEWLWDAAVWRDHPGLFGPPFEAGLTGWLPYLVPLLAVPQLTHYFLDAFLWRRGASAPLPVT